MGIGGKKDGLKKIHSQQFDICKMFRGEKEIDRELEKMDELKKENEVLLKRIAELEERIWSQ